MILQIDTDGKQFTISIGTHVLGTAKLYCDALLHCYVIQRAAGGETVCKIDDRTGLNK